MQGIQSAPNQQSIQKTRINGAMIGSLVGRCAILVGKVSDLKPEANQIQLLTSDNKDVTVFASEIPEAIQIDTTVEVTGVVNGDGTIKANQPHSLTILDGPEVAFDLANYDKLVAMANTKFKHLFVKG